MIVARSCLAESAWSADVISQTIHTSLAHSTITTRFLSVVFLCMLHPKGREV